MGDCASRPEITEEKYYVDLSDLKNDPEFLYKINLPILEEFSIQNIETAQNQERAHSGIYNLEKHIKNIEKMLKG